VRDEGFEAVAKQCNAFNKNQKSAVVCKLPGVYQGDTGILMVKKKYRKAIT